MTGRITRVSAPGKLILMGEHAAVYGRPALVTSIGLRMRVAMRRSDGDGVTVELPDLEVSSELPWERIHETTRRSRERWQAFEREPSPATFAALRPEGAQTLVELALGETALELARAEVTDEPGGWWVRIESDIPVGSGFGSSAAAAVGVVVGLLASFDAPHSWSVVNRVALEVERRQHGFPSGIDSATVFHGGVLRCNREGERLSVEPLGADPSLLRRIRVLDTGRPAESTGTIVADVRARRDRDPEAFEKRLDEMQAATHDFRRALAAGAGGLIEPVRTYQRCLQALGVVPTRVREIVREVERAGGAAKISGAGSLTGAGAGSLLVVGVGEGRLDVLDDLEALDAPLGVEGVRLESIQ